jgi:lipoyl(octanoyl) transferase
LISVLQLGTIDYATGRRLQQQLVELRKQEKVGDVLLLLEHTPVITLGRNAKASNVIASADQLEKRGVELFESERGGDVTFHGPGQIVGYPIFDLRGFAVPDEKRKTLGVIEFVRRLEEVLIRTCADFAIPTKRICGLTGVWTDPESTTVHVGTATSNCPVEQSSTATVQSATQLEERHSREGRDFDRAEACSQRNVGSKQAEAKLAAIGVHISRFVTSHGFALNVNTDLSYFNLIVPCGITSKPVTSMQHELCRPLDLNTVAESISRSFSVVFQTQILWLESLDALLCGAGTAGPRAVVVAPYEEAP